VHGHGVGSPEPSGWGKDLDVEHVVQDIGVVEDAGLHRGQGVLSAHKSGQALLADAEIVVNGLGSAPRRQEQAQRHAQQHAVPLSSEVGM
jgi:hypothetical protein